MSRKILSALLCVGLIFQQVGFVQAATELDLAAHFGRISGSLLNESFRPAHIRFFSYDILRDDLRFMLDKGDLKELKGAQLEKVSDELLNYFLIGLNLPNDSLWVNLRPDSEENIIEPEVARTDVGRIMLETDLQLKKDTARFTSPSSPEGKEYWQRLYKKADELYGSQQAEIITLNRPWIVPNEIIVRESNESAYIYKATLKVMLEQDHLKNSSTYNFKDSRAKALNDYSAQLMREMIIPKLNKEVNLSKNYAPLRQVYYSIILSRWFKSRFAGKNGKYASRIDKKDLSGLTSREPWSKTTYFNEYKKSFSQGEYNLKQPITTPKGQVIRAFFSGGMDLTFNPNRTFNGMRTSSPVASLMPQVLSEAGLVAPEDDTAIERAIASSPVTAGHYDDVLTRLATTDSVNLQNRLVLYRPDVNAPASRSKITDPQNARLVAAAKGIKALLDKGAKVVMIFHQGRPGTPDFIDEPFEHAKILNDLVGGNRVKAVNDLFGAEAVSAIKGLQGGQCIVLKPVRAGDPTNPGKTLEDNPFFVPLLRSLLIANNGVFVMDNLAVLHRSSNSVTGFQGVPTLAGPLMVHEITGANSLRNLPKPHLLVVGGSKGEKLKTMIEQLENGKADMVIAGGMPVVALLVAAKIYVNKSYTTDELFNLAKEVVGEKNAGALSTEFFPLLEQLAKVLVKYHNNIVIPVDMAYMEGDNARDVTLIGGKVPVGFNELLKGVGSQTDELYARVARRAEAPFQSAFVAGPLGDTEYEALVKKNRTVLAAVAEIPFWSTGGGHTEKLVRDLGFTPTYTSLAGGALTEFLQGMRLPGIDVVVDNSPEKIKSKPFVPVTAEEAHVAAHINLYQPLAQAALEEGLNLVGRTIVMGRGTKVEALKVTNTPLSTAVKESLGPKLSAVLAGLMTINVDVQNPWIDFSLTTLRTSDGRSLSLEAVRNILAHEAGLASILIPGEYNAKKNKWGAPGGINTRTLEERLNKLLTAELRRRGIDVTKLLATARSLPALVQVTESSIKGELKIATFVPTPNSDIYRLMQLAQDAGIDLKALFEADMPVPKTEGVFALAAGEALPLPASVEKKVAAKAEPSPLAGLRFAGYDINTDTQTIISKDRQASNDIWTVLDRVRQTGKLVRIMIPEGSEAALKLDIVLSAALSTRIVAMKGLNFSTTSVVHDNEKFTVFFIAPAIPYVIVGYGNEAIKLTPIFSRSGWGTPTVAINSLARPERVIHAFDMGYTILRADSVLVDKTTKAEVMEFEQDPAKLREFEDQLLTLLIDAYTMKAMSQLSNELPESQRTNPTAIALVKEKAKKLGEAEGRRRFAEQYKGLLSTALMAGKYNLIVDATPEGQGAANKKRLYERAIAGHPEKVIKVIYQGGEKAGVAEASFSSVSADFDKIAQDTHVRQVSCNTTGLSSMVIRLLEFFGTPLKVDNLAFRRVADPGDLKGGVVTVQYDAGYHHGPDLLTVTPEEDLPLIETTLNTDAALASYTRFHYHLLRIRRADGKAIDINKVKDLFAMQADLALIDLPAGVFDSTRIVELVHNLIPQLGMDVPEGEAHTLAAVVGVQATDDPAEILAVYAVPQESIVARGNVMLADALFGLATKDATIAIVNEASKIDGMVGSIQARMPIRLVENAVASSPISDARASQDLGGIDFRGKAMQVHYQPMGDFSKLNLNLPILNEAELTSFNIEQEIAKLEELVNKNFLPSGSRLKKILAACLQKGESDLVSARVMALLIKIGMLEEELCFSQESSREYKEALVFADSLAI